MKMRYQWRILTDDGLLKRPEPWGPYYDENELKWSYDSEQEAVEDYQTYLKDDGVYGVPDRLVLIKTYEKD